MHDLTGFQLDLLFVLRERQPSSGIELKYELEEKKYSSLLSGQIYHNLDDLVEESLVRKRDGDGQSNEYRLTRDGHEELREHEEWLRGYMTEPKRELATD